MAPNSQSTNEPERSQQPVQQTIQLQQSSSPQISEVTLPSNCSTVSSSQQSNTIFNGIPKTPERRVFDNSNTRRYADGYDSDGLHAPWLENNRATEQLIDNNEPSLPLRNDNSEAQVSSTPTPNPTAQPVQQAVVLTVEEARSLKVAELRIELRKRGIAVSGNKAILLERLIDAINKNVSIVEEGDDGRGREMQQNQADPTFDVGSCWEYLEADGDVIEENFAIEGGDDFYAPTVPQGENVANHVQKRNYLRQFDRPIFTGQTKLPKKKKIKGKEYVMKDRKTGDTVYETAPCNETVPNIEWCKAHNLDVKSHPVEWFEAFLPIRNKRGVTNAYASNAFSMENVLSWTNTKAQMQNAGLGGKYPDFKFFSIDELLRHFGLYLFQGLSPSPQVEMKFSSTKEDPVNGSDFIFNAFGCKSGHARRRHKHFKAFMTCVNPTIQPPDRDLNPNWKIHPLLKHMLAVNKEAVHIGQHLSCDEQTIGFQGHHRDKQRITYKAEGDGFLADCICSDGYTYNFYFRHQRDPPGIRRGTPLENMSPLHQRVLSLISQLPHKNYTLGMDNLFNSAKLARAAKNMPQRVMTHGVVRVSGRGVPSCVLQKEVSKKEDQERVRNTVHAAVVKGDSVCSDLVCISVYDTKPVYILSNACTEIKWTKKERKVWSKAKNEYVNGHFYRLNLIDFYNHNMGNVDLADQLRNYYRYDTSWHRNRKWWWSIFWWGYQVLLTNAYIMYRKYHVLHCSTHYVSHYDFIKQVALTWIDPRNHGPKAELKRKRDDAIEINDDSDDGVSFSRPSRKCKKLSLQGDNSTVSSGGATVRNARVNEKTLDPTCGALKCRLDSFSTHYPQHLDKKRAGKCQLHRWARGRDGKEVRNFKVLHCSTCRVSLCSQCWKVFHDVEDVVALKDTIAKS